MGVLKTILKWIRFILFCGCMGFIVFFAISNIIVENRELGIISGILCIVTIPLAVLNCVLYFKKLDRDNQLFAGIGSLILCGVTGYLMAEDHFAGTGILFAAAGLCCCFTINVFHWLAHILKG